MRSFIALSIALARCGVFAAAGLSAAGCATWQAPVDPDRAWMARAVSRAHDGVEVRAALLSQAEARAQFNADLRSELVQPLWLEIRNDRDEELILMLLSVDPNYISPAEAAWRTKELGEDPLAGKVQHFYEQGVPIIIEPRSTASGFVYSNYDPGAKAFTVELIGSSAVWNFEFVLEVPDFEADFHHVDPATLEPQESDRSLSRAELREYLEQLPCCVQGGDRKTPGDPLNLVIIGTSDDVFATLVRQGWDLTETIRAGTALRTALSSLFGSRYRTSPVSALYLFDRPQDAAFQKARGSVDERNHMRLWRAPVRYEDKSVWVGQISRDVGVKLSSRTITTHRIDSVVDEARLYVLLDLLRSGFVKTFGFVGGVGRATISAPRFNYTNDPYISDGNRVVIELADERRDYQEIEFLPWEILERDLPTE